MSGCKFERRDLRSSIVLEITDFDDQFVWMNKKDVKNMIAYLYEHMSEFTEEDE